MQHSAGVSLHKSSFIYKIHVWFVAVCHSHWHTIMALSQMTWWSLLAFWFSLTLYFFSNGWKVPVPVWSNEIIWHQKNLSLNNYDSPKVIWTHQSSFSKQTLNTKFSCQWLTIYIQYVFHDHDIRKSSTANFDCIITVPQSPLHVNLLYVAESYIFVPSLVTLSPNISKDPSRRAAV